MGIKNKHPMLYLFLCGRRTTSAGSLAERHISIEMEMMACAVIQVPWTFCYKKHLY